MLDKGRIRSTDHVPQPTGVRRRSRRLRRKGKRLAQAGMFAAVRGVAYTLGCAATAWFIVWLTQR